MFQWFLGVISILVGLVFLLFFFAVKSVIALILTVLFLLSGISLLKKPKPEEKSPDAIASTPKKRQRYSFNVVGVTKANDAGKDIQSLIRDIVREKLEYECEPYGGVTNREILEDYYGERAYEAVDVGGRKEISLIPEPNNPYDPNSIKVVHEHLAHIGYVPRKDNVRVAEIIKNRKYSTSWTVVGGKYKYVDTNDKVRVESGHHYGIVVDITFEEEEEQPKEETA
jgi:hypothetical protein